MAESAAKRAGDDACSAMVCVVPPLLARASTMGFEVRTPVPVEQASGAPVPRYDTLYEIEIVPPLAVSQFADAEPLSATTEFVMATEPPLA